jgi:hypothetical protein
MLGGHRRSRYLAPAAAVLLGVSICGAATVSMTATAAATVTPKPLVLNLGPEQLAELNLEALGLSNQELTGLLGGLPGASGSETALTPLLNLLLANPAETVQELLETLDLNLGSALTPEEVIAKVTEGATNPESLTGLLSGVSQALNGEQLGVLQQIVERLLGSLNPAQLEQIEKSLGGTGSIPELANSLIDELLGGGPQNAVETLLSDLKEVLSVTGSEAAEVAGVPLEALANTLDKTTKSLTEVTGVVGTLPTKELLSILTGPAESGLTVGVTPSGSGASTNTTSSTTNNYSTSTPASKAAAKAAKVTIVSDKVIGNTLDLVVKAPSAGQLTIRASHMKTAHRRVGRARTVTFKLHLKRAAAASLRRHKPRRSLKVKVKASFTPKSGSRSSATANVKFG